MKKSFIHPHSTTVCLPLLLSLLTAMTALAAEAPAAGSTEKTAAIVLTDEAARQAMAALPLAVPVAL